LHVVLVEPEIPPNTGSIGRLCAATRTRLHLIKPLGFSLDDRHLKRAGLDYWPYVDLEVHDSWAEFVELARPTTLLLFSARAKASYLDAPFATTPSAHLVFGGETRGLPPALLNAHSAATYRIPLLSPNVRSLNLANAVSIVVFEALRRRGALNTSEP